MLNTIISSMNFNEIVVLYNALMEDCLDIRVSSKKEEYASDPHVLDKCSNANYMINILTDEFDEDNSTYARRSSVKHCMKGLLACNFSYMNQIDDKLYTFPETIRCWNNLVAKYCPS